MLIDRPRETNWETLETLVESDEGSLVAALASGRRILLHIARSPERGRLEAERAAYLRGPGIPVIEPLGDGNGEALLLAGAESARPLRSAPPLPDTVWRAALRRLVSALSHAHGKGLVHGRITRDAILADPSGEFWIHGWADARPAVGRSPFHVGLDDVASDLRALGGALIQHFGSSEEADAAAVQRAVSRLAAFDGELARVLGRLVATDPRESYETATEVLTDLGEPDESMHDPLTELRFVGRRRLVRRILAHVERAGTRHAQVVALDVWGPPGSGRTRVVEETAAQARERGFVVMSAHGGAPNQPWGALGDLARQMLARLPADHPLRAERGLRVLVGDAPSPAVDPSSPGRSDGASVALADLLAAVFAERKGVLLLDDADALSSHALQAWRILVRQLSAASGSPESPRALLVTTSSQRLRHDREAAVETAELGDLGRRHVVSLLAALLTEPGKAALLADEILAVSGGRPGDIAAHLREMLERRTLVRVGHRFQFADPGQQVPPAAGADRLRRALAAAGREGSALAEAAAVAGRLRLTREVLGELAELSGPRLQSAAESAVAAGVLCRDGAAWRVRTDSFRVRLEAMLPDERRRGLHREILARLLDAAEPDWPSIAHHGRACGDPRAAEWTRTAFAQLRAAGRYDEAATHLDDARTSLDPAALDIELRLLHVETLLHAGRLDDATRCAAEVSRDTRATRLERGRALLSLAQLHRYDQAWSAVLAVELPEDCGDPLVLARIRTLRATAHLFRGRYDLAAREERLALAEVQDGEGASKLRPTLLLLGHDRALSTGDRDAALRAAIEHARLAYASRDRLEFALDLVRLANAIRQRGDSALARKLITGALAYGRRRLGSNPLIGTWALNIRALLESPSPSGLASSRAAQAAALLAARTGCTILSMNRRIQSVVASAYAGTIAQSDCRYMQGVAHNIEAVPADVISFATHCLIIGLLFVGEHAAIHTLARRARTLGQPQALLARTEQWVFVSDRMLGRLPIDHERCRVRQSSSVASHSQCGEEMVRAYTPPDRYSPEDYQRAIPVVAVLAQSVRQGEPLTTEEAGNSLSQLRALVKTLPQGSFVGADLVNSMALLGARMFDEEAWSQLMDQVLIRNRLLPPAAEWRRAGALALAAKWKGRPRTADSLVREAQRLATMLSDPKFGEGGSAAAREALERLVQVGPRIPSMKSSHDAPNWLATINAVAMNRTVRDPFERAWAQQLAEVGQVRRLYVAAADANEGMEFARRVTGRDGILVVHADSSASIPEGMRAICVVHDPGAGTRVHGELLVRIERHVCEGAYLIVVGPSGRPAPKAWSGDHRALFALAAGQVVELASVVGDRTAGCEVLRWLIWRRTRRLVEFDATAEALLASTNWSGGLAEMESVAASLEAMGSTKVSAGVLARLGWSARASRRVGCVSIEVVDAIAGCLRGGEALSSRDVHLRAGVPLRTVNRALSELLAVGRLVRTGRGRATRYCGRIEATEASDSRGDFRRVRGAGGHTRAPEMGVSGPPHGESRHA